ncbi:hypothetical protein ACP49_09425 [Clostridium botulinum]|uniref:DUF2634 domain-containing protein n=1 Tax=Clostridium botulinum TaxID=1491 RepID=UPI0005F8BB5E|nr:DUF2634 domain-containing protein [Clostridium botulinum]KOM97278.1 hypothetical protein ACP53_04315 [Clostridium botulinum]KON00781.1 hypothetical protein ACP49_09425 [Clostridium botulinum]MBY7003569.1 DUF2634 domain-containing protein [Clostridium botulinum]MCR1145957.1 DUF2634 domain-containing protein [Clostridium botulinum]NFH93170.1 DUF2634 domain-containing protein [Clostridium botulinum]
MALLPEEDITAQEVEEIEEEQTLSKLGKVFLFDFKNNEYVIRNGKLVECTERQALEQWIHWILLTYKDKYNVYKNTDFYCNIEDLISKKRNAFVLSELQREVEEALKKHRYIDHIENFITVQEKSILNVQFDVVLKNDEVINISA